MNMHRHIGEADLNAVRCPSTRRIPVNYIMNLVIQTPWRSTQEAEGTPLERVQVVNSGARVQIPPSPSNPITFVIGFLFCPKDTFPCIFHICPL